MVEPSQLTFCLERPSFLQFPEAKWPSFDQSIHKEETEVMKYEAVIANVNAVAHKTITAEVNAKLEIEDNLILRQLLKACLIFPKISWHSLMFAIS